MTHTTPRRSGFTLIELLVVIGLIAVLSAIAAGTYFRVRSTEQIKASEAVLAKINPGLNRLWSATVDQARQEFKSNKLLFKPGFGTKDQLVGFCGNDSERAEMLYVYLRMKLEFPQTVAEAKTDLSFTGNAGTAALPKPVSFILPYRPTFAKLVATGSGTTDSAVILYLMLTEKGTRGETFGTEAAGALVGVVANDQKVFTDAWGTPVGFVRYAVNNEIAGAPYARAGANKDPIDTTPNGKLSGAWNNAVATNTTAAAAAVFGTGTFSGSYWLYTCVSAGPNKTFDSFAPGAGLITVNTTTDDLLGYRLRRQGDGGN